MTYFNRDRPTKTELAKSAVMTTIAVIGVVFIVSALAGCTTTGGGYRGVPYTDEDGNEKIHRSRPRVQQHALGCGDLC